MAAGLVRVARRFRLRVGADPVKGVRGGPGFAYHRRMNDRARLSNRTSR